MPPKVPPQVSPQVPPQVPKPNNVPNDVMKLKMEMVAARAEAEQKKKLQNNEMAAARAAAEQKKKLQNNQMAAARAAAEEKKKIHENQMAAARAAAEEKKQMLMEQMIAQRAAAEEKKQMLREQLMAERAAAEEKKQMLKEEQMLKNELAAVGNEMPGDELGMDENIDLEGFTLDEMVLGDEPVLDFETGPEDSRTLPTDITNFQGDASLNLFTTKRSDLLNLNNQLSFEYAASAPVLTPNMQKMIGTDSSFNIRYAPMNIFTDASNIPNNRGLEYRVARKFNDEIMPKYLDLFYPQTTGGETNSGLDTKFPTHSYFPDVKDTYENSEIFKILDRMPKGGILHIHSGALMDIDWVLRIGKWANLPLQTSNNVAGLLADLNNDHGFFVNNDTIHNENAIYIPSKISEKLFTSFKKGSYSGISSPVAGVRNSPSYNPVTNIYTDLSGVNWLDLSATNSLNKIPVYTEAVQKNIRRCLTLVGDDDPKSCAAYDIPKIWEVFELVNQRWSSLRDAGDNPGKILNTMTGKSMNFSAHLFAQGMKVVYDNKVQIVEIRLGFGADFRTTDGLAGSTLATEVHRIQTNFVEKTRLKIHDYTDALTLLDVLVAAESVGAGGGTKTARNFKLRVILSTPRSIPKQYADYHLVAAFMLKWGATYAPASVVDNMPTVSTSLNYAAGVYHDVSWNLTWRFGANAGEKETLYNLITGYDMIREEDRFNKTDFYLSTFLKVNKLEKVFNLVPRETGATGKMDYFFHDGESNWHTNYNVVDAVMLGSKRVGHGFNIDMRPGVVAKAIRDNICFEISPISNQILQYTPDIRCHYANGLFRQGLPMVISNDDPIMYGYNGLTYDFFAAAVSWNLSYKAIKRLAWSSIEYSSLSSQDKQRAKFQFFGMFNSWITKIANVYNIKNSTKVNEYYNKVEGKLYLELSSGVNPSLEMYMDVCC
jgi:hypothetical protein